MLTDEQHAGTQRGGSRTRRESSRPKTRLARNHVQALISPIKVKGREIVEDHQPSAAAKDRGGKPYFHPQDSGVRDRGQPQNKIREEAHEFKHEGVGHIINSFRRLYQRIVEEVQLVLVPLVGKVLLYFGEIRHPFFSFGLCHPWCAQLLVKEAAALPTENISIQSPSAM
eukprot:IDg15082t1